MKEKIINLVFETMSSHPDVNWNELYLMLFKRAYIEGDKELATQAFYKIIVEAIRTKNTWALDELVEQEENLPAMDDLKLMLFAKNTIKEIPPKYHHLEYEFEKSPKFEFREGSQYSLCACCHDYVLTCDEIQNFPLINEESYIREKFQTAFSQNKIHKRYFIIDRLLNEYSDKAPDLSLLFELWIVAEKNGIHVEPLRFIDKPEEIILEEIHFKSFLRIVNFRHHEHDSMIDDVVELLLERRRYELAYYLNAKLSSPYVRLFKAIGSVLSVEGDEHNMIIFLNKVVQSVQHEKVEND
jgi:hypothetical protein